MINRVDHQDTKIVATVGPASNTKEALERLIKEGVDVFRLNFSHGSHADHKKVIDILQHIQDESGIPVGILADLQGPKLRVGIVPNGGKELKKEDEIIFSSSQDKADGDRIIYLSYESFAQDVKVGERVLCDDGKIILKVVESNKVDEVKLKVMFGGVLKSNKGVNLPDTKISLPSLTEKDLRDLSFILTQQAVNWIALSFVRTPKDVKDLQQKIAEAGHHAKVIAKIEKPEAVAKIDKIIKHSNAIMVARGDLGVEVPMERLPAIQKEIVRKCINRARPVIVATQMMESMMTNPSPTRAEITDVANAVLDGADALMLSGETAVGNHPHLVVRAMNKIIEEAEKHYSLRNIHHSTSPRSRTFLSDVVCFNAAKVAEDLDSKAIVGMTVSGYTAFKISSCRPKANIFIFSENKEILSTLNLVWGVRGYFYNKYASTDETIEDVIRILKEDGRIFMGDTVVNTASMPLAKRFRTNMLKVTVVD